MFYVMDIIVEVFFDFDAILIGFCIGVLVGGGGVEGVIADVLPIKTVSLINALLSMTGLVLFIARS